MKTSAAIVLSFCIAYGLAGCSATERNTETSDQLSGAAGNFIAYAEDLERLSVPLSLQSDSEDFPLPPEGIDSVLYQQFKHSYALQPAGILYQNPEYVAVLEYSAGDYGMVPLLTTYTPAGIKIDSLAPYSVSGTDMGYQATETVTFKENKEIEIVATVTRAKVQEGEVVEGSEETTTRSTIYRIQPDGRFSVEE